MSRTIASVHPTRPNPHETLEWKDLVVVDGEVQLHRYRTVPDGNGSCYGEKHVNGEWVRSRDGTVLPPSETFGHCTVDVGHQREGAAPAPTHPNGGLA